MYRTILIFFLAYGFILLAGLQTAQAAYEGFEPESYQSDWEFINPLGDGTQDASAVIGHMQLSMPSGLSHDCYGTTAQCVRFFAPETYTGVNTVFETKIDGGELINPYQAYGIMLWQDKLNYLRFDLWKAWNNPQLTAWEVSNGTGTHKFIGASIPSPAELYLRFVKEGTQYTASYGTDGVTWVTAGTFSSSIAPTRYGLALMNYYIGNGTAPITMNVDYFSDTEFAAPQTVNLPPGPVQNLGSSMVTKSSVTYTWDPPVGGASSYKCSTSSSFSTSWACTTPYTRASSCRTDSQDPNAKVMYVWAIGEDGIPSDVVSFKQRSMFCSQLYDYNDVVVITNDASVTSNKIAYTFISDRSIPTRNLIRTNTTTAEEITPTIFADLRSQIEAALISRNLVDRTNYLVTTKGMPLKIHDPQEVCYSQSSRCASVNSELELILGPYASYIGGSGPQMSPYFYQSVHFSRGTYGIYLTTRLDGYTLHDVMNMIRRSAAPAEINASSAGAVSHYVFDQDPVWVNPINTYMARAHSALINLGLISTLETSTNYVQNETNVRGYDSWGTKDHNNNGTTWDWRPYFTWAPGALGYFNESYSATTFIEPTDPNGPEPSLIGELIKEGITGARGQVFEPYSNDMPHSYILFPRQAAGYNLAESFGMSDLLVSWMGVVVGDPKATLAVTANIRVMLQVPYDSAPTDSTMRTDLGSHLPLQQPFGPSPWNYNGTESVTNVPAGVVDWALLEVRGGITWSSTLAKRAALLRSDGRVVDLDGVTPVSFPTLIPGNYYVTVSQRNYVPIMTSAAIALSPSSALYDFTTAQAQAYGTNPMVEVETGVFGLVAGDVTAPNFSVDHADEDYVVANPQPSQSYWRQDVTLDGLVNVTDSTLAHTNIGRTGQIP